MKNTLIEIVSLNSDLHLSATKILGSFATTKEAENFLQELKEKEPQGFSDRNFQLLEINK